MFSVIAVIPVIITIVSDHMETVFLSVLKSMVRYQLEKHLDKIKVLFF